VHQHLQDKIKFPSHLTQISEKGATLLFAIPAHTLVTPATRDATVWPKMRRTVSMVTRITGFWVNLNHRHGIKEFRSVKGKNRHTSGSRIVTKN